MKSTPPNWLSWLIIAQCLIAIAALPLNYYHIMRLTVSGYTGYMAWLYLQAPRNNWSWAFFVALLINNPVFPIFMPKDSHAIFDIATAALVFVEFYPRGGKTNLQALQARWPQPANKLADSLIAATIKIFLLGIRIAAVGALALIVWFGITKYQAIQEAEKATQIEAAQAAARSKLEMAEANALSKITATVDRSGFKCLSNERLPWQGKGLTIEIMNGSDRTAIFTKFTILTFENGHSQPSEPVGGTTDLTIEPGKTIKACVASGAWNPIDDEGANPDKYNFNVSINEVTWAS